MRRQANSSFSEIRSFPVSVNVFIEQIQIGELIHDFIKMRLRDIQRSTKIPFAERTKQKVYKSVTKSRNQFSVLCPFEVEHKDSQRVKRAICPRSRYRFGILILGVKIMEDIFPLALPRFRIDIAFGSTWGFENHFTIRYHFEYSNSHRYFTYGSFWTTSRS